MQDIFVDKKLQTLFGGNRERRPRSANNSCINDVFASLLRKENSSSVISAHTPHTHTPYLEYRPTFPPSDLSTDCPIARPSNYCPTVRPSDHLSDHPTTCLSKWMGSALDSREIRKHALNIYRDFKQSLKHARPTRPSKGDPNQYRTKAKQSSHGSLRLPMFLLCLPCLPLRDIAAWNTQQTFV